MLLCLCSALYFLPAWFLLLPTVGVGRIFESVCLFVCLQYNSKTNDPKVFKLGIGNEPGIPWKWYCFGGQGHRVSKFISHTRTAIHRHLLGDVTSRLWFHGCLLHASLTFTRWRNQSLVVKLWTECLLVDLYTY